MPGCVTTCRFPAIATLCGSRALTSFFIEVRNPALHRCLGLCIESDPTNQCFWAWFALPLAVSCRLPSCVGFVHAAFSAFFRHRGQQRVRCVAPSERPCLRSTKLSLHPEIRVFLSDRSASSLNNNAYQQISLPICGNSAVPTAPMMAAVVLLFVRDCISVDEIVSVQRSPLLLQRCQARWNSVVLPPSPLLHFGVIVSAIFG